MNLDDYLKSLEEKIDDRMKIQKFIYKCKENFDFNDILKFLKKHNFSQSCEYVFYVIEAIIVVMTSTFGSNHLVQILKELIKYAKVNIPSDKISYDVFLQNQITNYTSQYHEKIDRFSVNNFNLFYQIENDFHEIRIIKDDKIEEFQKIINFNPSILKNKYQMHFKILQNVYLMDFAAYFGSVSIFKYLYLNEKASHSSNIISFAIASGNFEIIHICETISDNYSGALIASIQYHRYQLFDWILNNELDCISFEALLVSIWSHNLYAFSKMIRQYEVIDIFKIIKTSISSFEPNMLFLAMLNEDLLNAKKDFDDQRKESINELVQQAIKNSSYSCLKILLDNLHFNKDEPKKEFIVNAIKYCKLPFLELIDSHFKINFNEQIFGNGVTILHILVQLNDYEKVKYILKKDDINLNTKDNEGKTPLMIAAKNGNTKIAELLLQSKKIRIKAIDEVMKPFILCFFI